MLKIYKGHLIRLAVAIFLVALALILAPICDSNRTLADNFFVPVARVLSAPIKFVTGLFPLSLFELCVFAAVPAVAAICVLYVLKCRKKGVPVLRALAKFWLTVLFIAGVCFFVYYLLFSLPGRRTRMLDAVYGGKVQSESSELYDLTVYMIENANDSHVKFDDLDMGEINALLKDGYKELHKENSYIGGYPASAKPLLSSKYVSYLDISGIFFALTQESNVNTDSMLFSMPFTMAHEMAHSVLVVSEAEANFTAFLACEKVDNPYVRYSAYFTASIYCLNALARVDFDLYKEAYSHISAEMREDLAAQSAHLKKYEGPVKEVSNKVNDWSIKTSGQPSGIASYGEVVDLFMAWFKQK